MKFLCWHNYIYILPAQHLEEILHHYVRMAEDGLKLEEKENILKHPNLYLKMF